MEKSWFGTAVRDHLGMRKMLKCSPGRRKAFAGMDRQLSARRSTKFGSWVRSATWGARGITRDKHTEGPDRKITADMPMAG